MPICCCRSQELDELIRYETHLEDQIERKLRQFYARRREPVLRRAKHCRQQATNPRSASRPAKPHRWGRRGMTLEDNWGEMMILFADTCGNCVATPCPSVANNNEAENILKTKGRKWRFFQNEAENILKQSQLPKTVETQNFGGKMSAHAERRTGRITPLIATPLGVARAELRSSAPRTAPALGSRKTGLAGDAEGCPP